MKTNSTRSGISRKKPTRPHGFTLVELLVVITIIIALAALIFTITGKIKAKAYQANALSSLRQVAAFNMAYATENNGDINTLRWSHDPLEGELGWVTSTYWGRLQPYLFPDAASTNQGQLNKNLNQRLDQLFSTKDSDKMTGTAFSGIVIYHDISGLPVPFAFNAALVPWGKFAKVSTFSDPSQILHFTYGFGMFNESNGKEYTPMPRQGNPVLNPIYFLQDHKALGAFLDGHIESLAAPIPSRKFK